MTIVSTSTVVISKPNLKIFSDFDTSIDEQLVISTLQGLSEGVKMSERLGCFQEKGENEGERLLNCSKDACELVCKSSIFEAEEKGEGVRSVSPYEIFMQK